MTTMPRVGEVIALRRYNYFPADLLVVVLTITITSSAHGTVIWAGNGAEREPGDQVVILHGDPSCDDWYRPEELTDDQLVALARYRLCTI